MVSAVLEFALGATCPAAGWALGCKMAGMGFRLPLTFAVWCAGASATSVLEAVTGSPWWAAGSALSALVALVLWWLSRRKGRKRAAKLTGAKARALREKLVKSMPRWTPRLVPQRIPA